ncbi:2460_t:CDS:2, partial [Gigaspora rosea]
SIKKNVNTVNIVAGDFNVNLDPDINRISHEIPQNDLSKEKLKELTCGMVDTSVAARLLYTSKRQEVGIPWSQGWTISSWMNRMHSIAKRHIQSLVAGNEDLSNLQLVIERLRRNLQDELTNLADKWQVHSNARWIESGEK